MAAKKTQRVGILIIMSVMIVGTLGSFAVMILTQKSQEQAAANYQKAVAAYTKEQQAHQVKVDAQSEELSATYYPQFSQYFGQVGAFDIDSVKTLGTEDLQVGNGEEITGTTSFSTYFLGWDANGNKFTGGNNVDFDKQKLTTPFAIAGLDNASLIDGWKEGIKGMHIGGIRLLTIPADKAYKEAGSKDSSGNQVIAANMPLKFLVMAIPSPAAIDESDAYTKAANDYYKAMSDYYGAR